MLKLTERQCLVKALSLAKDKIRNMNKAFGNEIPNRAYQEWRELSDTAVYLEGKLNELNQKENLYEYQAGHSLDIILREVTRWQERQFPDRTNHSISTHLLEEVKELYLEPTNGEEMADVQMLLICLADFNKINLTREVALKLAKNKARKWSRVDDNGVSHHVKEKK